MKKTLKIFGILTLMVMAFASCSKDDNPADNDLFVGTYKGDASYVNAGDEVNINEKDVNILVSKVGDSYTFKFTDTEIPTITQKIEKGKENSAKLSFTDGVHYIKINENVLTISYLKDGGLWTVTSAKRQ